MNKRTENYLLSLVRNGYNEIAESFNESRKKPMKEMVSEIVKKVDVRTGSRVLDLGCGNGRFFEILPEDIFYLGLDSSKNLIKFAKEKYGDEFQVLDILKLDELKENNFNFIFSWAVFHHIPGRRLRIDFLNKVYDKMEAGGVFVFSVWRLEKKKGFKLLSIKSFFSFLLKGMVLDRGDIIFDWRGDKSGGKSLRYYHSFRLSEIVATIKKSKLKKEGFLEDAFNYYFILKK